MALAASDGLALMRAVDRERSARGLDWPGAAVALHAQSALLNERLGGNAMCSGALVRTVRRGTMSCQYALVLLRWLGRAPEDFLVGDRRDEGDTALPTAGPDRRLVFDLPALHGALDDRRRAIARTWAALGDDLGASAARLTNLRTARLADAGLVLQVTQHLGVPAARFVRPVARAGPR